MFKSLDSIASVAGFFMYLTIAKFKQVLRSWKGLDYNTASHTANTVPLFPKYYRPILVVLLISRLHASSRTHLPVLCICILPY